MRYIIIIVLIIISMSNNVIDGLKMKSYVKNINNAVYKKCNKEAFNITNNIEVYNCLLVNSSNKCSHLDNYTDYNNNRILCVKKINSDIGTGILTTIIFWFILSLCFH